VGFQRVWFVAPVAFAEKQVMSKTGYRILMFPQRTYPCDHAMLETVYTRLLPRRCYQIHWIMRRGSSTSLQSKSDWNGTPVHLVPDYKPHSWSQQLAWISWAYQSYKIANEITVKNPIDIVQVRNELTSAFVAFMLKKKRGIPFVYQRSFPSFEARQWEPTTNRAKTIYRMVSSWLGRSLQWWLLCQADLVLAISDQMRAEMVKQGLPEDRVISFPLGVDTDIRPENFDRQTIRLELELGDSPVVIFFGSMDRLRRLEFLLAVMSQVLMELPTTKMLMVGSASREEDYLWLKDQAVQQNLGEAVQFVGAVPRAQVPYYLAVADLSVAPYPPTEIDVSRSPTKVLESLGMAIPVIANREIPDQFKVITESGGGECVPYNVPAFAAAVLRFLKDRSMAKQAGQRGREYVVRERSYSILADYIDEQYSKLIIANQRRLSLQNDTIKPEMTSITHDD
jgi:glycosyltransferase involved in cell wall biosynthesis